MKTLRTILVAAVWVVAACPECRTAAAATAAPDDSALREPVAANRPPYVEGDLLVKFRGGPRSEAAARAKSTFKHTVKRDFEHIGWQHIQLAPGMSVEKALARYQQDPDVLAAEPNGFMHALGDLVIPNDPFFPRQWGLAAIGAPFAWAETTGSTNVVVAIIDSGINYLHEDLAANMWRNPGEIPGNGIDDDGNGYPDDVFGIDLVSDDSDPMDQPGSGIYHGTGIGIIRRVCS